MFISIELQNLNCFNTLNAHTRIEVYNNDDYLF